MTSEDLQELYAKYRDTWHIWPLGQVLYATRRGRPLTTDQMYMGLAHTVPADSVKELDEALHAQAEIQQQYEREQQAGS